MIVLDENITDDQRRLLRGWNIRARKIGKDVGHKGLADEGIIPYLHQLPRPTFFTCDGDFHRLSLCHPAYCIVYLAVDWRESATFIRRFLRHPSCSTFAQRKGTVARVSHIGIHVWRIRQPAEQMITWQN
jgi:hypothetical protein